jgi:YD repeat-containing protein
VLVDGPGVELAAPKTYRLWDDLSTKGPDPIYTGTDSAVPDGTLRNGGSYHYTVTDAQGRRRGPYAFTVQAGSVVSGAYAAAVDPEPMRSGAGEMGIGLSFTTADVGTTPALVATDGLRAGLPAGWRWRGLGNGIGQVVVENAFGFYGFDKVIEVHHDGGGVDLLGCVSGDAWGCSPIDGDATGNGLQATFSGDASQLTIHQPSSGRTWSVETWSAPEADDPQDELARREGRVASTSAPGAAEVRFGYAQPNGGDIETIEWMVGSSADPMTWTIFRGRDRACSGALPPGFVATPDDQVCGWTLPNGAWFRLLHVDPGGQGGLQIGRVLRLPGVEATPKGCAPGDPAACQGVWDQVAVTDWAWSSTGHPRAMRGPGVAQAVMGGAIAPDDLTVTTQASFDAAGRVAKVQAAAHAPGGVRTVTDHTYPAPDAGFPSASHQQTISATASDGSIPAQTMATAVDDGVRRVGTLDTSGARTLEVWMGDRDVQLARIGSDGAATTQVFDAQDRKVASYEAPASAIDRARCTPGTIDPAACTPTGGWPQISAELLSHDGAGVAGGLTAEWYTSRSADGLPIARTTVDAFDAATSSLALDPPSDGSLADGGSVRITGGLTGTTPTSLEVDLKGGSADSVRSFVDGTYYGALPGSGTIDLIEPDQPMPLRIELVVSFTQQPPTGLRVADASDGESVAYTARTTKQRWGAVTETRSIEASPAGSSTFAVVAERQTYGDLAAADATVVATVGCGSFGSWDAARTGCGDGVTVEKRKAYEPDGYGGSRLASITSEGDDVTSFQYWGRAEAPGSSAIPAAISGTPQHGLLRSMSYPDGRVTTFAYDATGRPVCSATSDGGDAAWSCATYDGADRVTQESYRSPAGGPDVTIDYRYDLGTGPSPRTATKVRSEGGTAVSTEKISVSALGRATSYELRPEVGGAAATTTYAYDAFGRPTGAATTVAGPDGTATFRTGRSYTAGTGLLAEVSVGGTPAAQVRYGGPSPWLMSGISYPAAGSLSMAFGYDAAVRPVSRTWTLGDGSTVDDATTISSAGRIAAARFDGVDTTYGYDTIGRLTSATTGDRTAQYGWNADGNLVCTARDLEAPAASCADAPGHVTNTYEGGRLTATTDTELALPADAYDAAGNLTGVGDRTFGYDARQQLSTITQGDEAIAIVRDSSGRVLSHAGPDGTTRFLYASPDDPTPVATLPPGGGVSFSTALPGGVVWTSSGSAITDVHGNPSLWLAPDGTRRPEAPTVRYGPFGEQLTPKATAGESGTTTTTSTPAPDATTTTTAPSAATTAPGAEATTTEATTTVPDAAAEGGSTTTVGPGADPVVSTTTAPADGTTTTTAAAEQATTTTAAAEPATTTTTTTTEVGAPPVGVGVDPHGWADRLALDDGIVNLGQRAMLPAFGAFTGPDPVPGGSCTVYGYTCSDPVNASDLDGTISTGTVAAVAVSVAFAFLIPGGAGIAGLIFEGVMTAVMGFAGGVTSLFVHTWADRGWAAAISISRSDLLEAGFIGGIIGAGSGLLGGFLTSFTRFTRTLEASAGDYGYGVQLVTSDYMGGTYTGFRTMGGIRKVALRYWRCRQLGLRFLDGGRAPLFWNSVKIFGLKQAASISTHVALYETHYRSGLFD